MCVLLDGDDDEVEDVVLSGVFLVVEESESPRALAAGTIRHVSRSAKIAPLAALRSFVQVVITVSGPLNRFLENRKAQSALVIPNGFKP